MSTLLGRKRGKKRIMYIFLNISRDYKKFNTNAVHKMAVPASLTNVLQAASSLSQNLVHLYKDWPQFYSNTPDSFRKGVYEFICKHVFKSPSVPSTTIQIMDTVSKFVIETMLTGRPDNCCDQLYTSYNWSKDINIKQIATLQFIASLTQRIIYDGDIRREIVDSQNKNDTIYNYVTALTCAFIAQRSYFTNAIKKWSSDPIYLTFLKNDSKLDHLRIPNKDGKIPWLSGDTVDINALLTMIIDPTLANSNMLLHNKVGLFASTTYGTTKTQYNNNGELELTHP